MQKLAVRVLSLALVVVACPLVALYAQNSNAVISGTVTDQSGAVVPNAQLTLTLTTSGTVRTVTAGQDGNYTFPNLPVGTY